jgi:WD40 repeat protein
MKLHIFVCSISIFLAACSIPTGIRTETSAITPGNAARPQLITPSATIELPISTRSPKPSPTETTSDIHTTPITVDSINLLVEKKTLPAVNPGRLTWFSDTNTIAVLQPGGIILLDGADLTLKKEYKLAENTSLLDFDSASQRMALTTDRLTVEIRELDGTVLQTIAPPGGFGSASFEQGGRHIWLTSMEEFKAISYDIQTGQESSSCGGFETAAPVYSAFPSPKGNWLVWIARATIQLNRLPGCETAAHIGHEDFIISHTFTHDEKMLVTSTGGTVNGEFQPLIYFWDAFTGKQVSTLSLKETPAMDMSFSPDDSILASAGSGLILWDRQAGKELRTLAPIDQRYTSVAFSPDGYSLAAADETGIHLFAIKP